MQAESIDYTKGETPMTDYQTKLLLATIADMLSSSASIEDARTRFMAITGNDVVLKGKFTVNQGVPCCEGMTDYQFQQFEKLWDERDGLTREITTLREENRKLKENQRSHPQ